ncbi:MAG: hypothetical protein DMG14_26010 [Acidobacteria bacterium]|nr:MAG: hypothetical protein DMG14_26010 [Acidobacteriota bacterium]PYS49225.1 MAG: hypothetical protein DMG13_23840 [Acidobacteriota bacterium]
MLDCPSIDSGKERPAINMWLTDSRLSFSHIQSPRPYRRLIYVCQAQKRSFGIFPPIGTSAA